MTTKNKLKNFVFGFLAFVLLWYIGSILVNSSAFPSPFKVFVNIPVALQDEMLKHLLASSKRLFIALSITLVLGTFFGVIMGRFPKMNSTLYPLVFFTYPIPKTAFLPVIMILYGLGDNSKITLIVLITVFQFIVAIRDAVLNLDKEYYTPLKSLGASEVQMIFTVTLPAILPTIFTNLKIAIGTGLSILFFAENYGTKYGLGYYIQDSWARIDYISMYSGILVMAFLGFVLFLIVDILEDRLCNWKNV